MTLCPRVAALAGAFVFRRAGVSITSYARRWAVVADQTGDPHAAELALILATTADTAFRLARLLRLVAA